MRPVQRQPVAHRAAEQRIDRHAQRLRLDVEQRVLDRRHRLLVDAARRLARHGIIGRGDPFDRPRIHADQALRQAADHGGKTRAAVAFVVFGPADDAIVGGDLEKRKVAPAGVAVQILDPDNFHWCSFSVKADGPGQPASGSMISSGFIMDFCFIPATLRKTPERRDQPRDNTNHDCRHHDPTGAPCRNWHGFRRRRRRRGLCRDVHAASPARARLFGTGVRGRRRRRRHLVLEPVSGRALRRREHAVLVLLLGGAGPGVELVGEIRAARRNPLLRQPCRRSLRSSPAYRVRHARDRGDVR